MDIIPSSFIIKDGLSAYQSAMNNSIENMANAENTKGPNGSPYKRKVSVFESYLPTGKDGVQSIRVSHKQDTSPGNKMYDPSHPHADANGNVEMPNVSVLQEKVNYIKASKAYSSLVAYFGSNTKLIGNLISKIL